MGGDDGRVLVATWAGGGDLPPLLAAAGLLAARGFDVEVLVSAATEEAARRDGLPTHGYRRAPQPDAIARVLAEPPFAEAAWRAAGAIAGGQPDRTAGDALVRLAAGPGS